MATLYIAEFAGLSLGWNGATIPSDNLIQIAQAPTLAYQNVAVASGTAGSSAAFSTNTHIIRVVADTNCFIDIGSAPTATTVKMPIIANSAPEYFGVRPGDKISVIGP